MSLAKTYTVALCLFTLFLSSLSFSQIISDESFCEADLARLNKNFCLKKDSAKSPLKYKWNVADDKFNLKTISCLEEKTLSDDPRDLLIAIDKSSIMASWDKEKNSKLGSLVTQQVKDIINEYEKLAIEKKGKSTFNISLVLFSSIGDCKKFDGVSLKVGDEFPCVYVPMLDMSESKNKNMLNTLLDKSEGIYSSTAASSASQLHVPLSLVEKNENPPLILFFTEGKSFVGEEKDFSAYLKKSAYDKAEKNIQEKFVTDSPIFFIHSGIKNPIYSIEHKDIIESYVCEKKNTLDCPNTVSLNQPETWPANLISGENFLKTLLKDKKEESALLKLSDSSLIENIHKIKKYNYKIIPVQSFGTTFSGSGFLSGFSKDDKTLLLKDLPSEKNLALELNLKTSKEEIKIPLEIELSLIEPRPGEMLDKEMRCFFGPNYFKKPLKLQGGSGSPACGVVGNDHSKFYLVSLILFFIPLLFILPLNSILFLLTFIFFAKPLLSESLNINHHRPILSGLSNNEISKEIIQGEYQFGLEMDYAKNPLELVNEKNEPKTSIASSMLTNHLLFKWGFFSEMDLSLDLPFVYVGEINRDQTHKIIHEQKAFKLSDAQLGIKYHAIEKKYWGLGIKPIIILPLGSQEYLQSDGNFNPGIFFILSGNSDRFLWSFNSGYTFRSSEVSLHDNRAGQDIRLREQFIESLAVGYQLNSQFVVDTSFRASFYSLSDISFNELNPSEINFGGKFSPLNKNLHLMSQIGRGIGSGFGSPDYRISLGMSYSGNKSYPKFLGKK